MNAVDRVKILVVDDEPPIVELIRGYLEREGYEVSVARDGLSAVDVVRGGQPDLVVLDVMLPGIDGIEVCRRIRMFTEAYVLMLTARSEEIDRIVGLSVGADDYLVKPFSPRELVARIKALLRRPRLTTPKSARTDLVVDVPRRTVTARGSAVTLTATEFEILATLARDPGLVISRGQLLDRVWGPEFVGDDHLVDVHVANLRHKIGEGFIDTIRGVGYRLTEAP